MELLTIHHEDFTLYVECSKYDAIWGKAVRNVGSENLLTTYTWTDGVTSAKLGDEALENGGRARAVFFDNAEYPVWVDFGTHVSKAGGQRPFQFPRSYVGRLHQLWQRDRPERTATGI